MRVAVTLEGSRDAAALKAANLSFAQGQSAQCYACSDPGCCTYLRVHTFWAKHRSDLDRAADWLHCDGIDLGIDQRGEWSVFWCRHCRHLDQTDDSCRVHGTPVQPDVCKRYPGEDCWYQRVLPVRASNEFVRIDLARLDWIRDRVDSGPDGRLVSFPPRAGLIESFDEMPINPRPLHERPHGHAPVALEFPLTVPWSAEKLDFVRMALGYPGVEVGVREDGTWRLILNTTGPAELAVPLEHSARYRYEDFEALAALAALEH